MMEAPCDPAYRSARIKGYVQAGLAATEVSARLEFERPRLGLLRDRHIGKWVTSACKAERQ